MDAATVARELVRIIPLFLRNVGSDLRYLEPHLTPAHFRVLHVLNRGSYHLGELADLQGVTQATMSNTVTMLVERGWAQRTVCADDRRKVYVEITPEGKDMLVQIVKRLEEQVAEHLSGLSEADLRQAHRGLVVLQQALLAHAEGEPCKLEGEPDSMAVETSLSHQEN